MGKLTRKLLFGLMGTFREVSNISSDRIHKVSVRVVLQASLTTFRHPFEGKLCLDNKNNEHTPFRR